MSIWILLGLTSLADFNTLPSILDPLVTEAGESRVVWQGGPFGSVNLYLERTFGRNILYSTFGQNQILSLSVCLAKYLVFEMLAIVRGKISIGISRYHIVRSKYETWKCSKRSPLAIAFFLCLEIVLVRRIWNMFDSSLVRLFLGIAGAI